MSSSKLFVATRSMLEMLGKHVSFSKALHQYLQQNKLLSLSCSILALQGILHPGRHTITSFIHTQSDLRMRQTLNFFTTTNHQVPTYTLEAYLEVNFTVTSNCSLDNLFFVLHQLKSHWASTPFLLLCYIDTHPSLTAKKELVQSVWRRLSQRRVCQNCSK